jgi:hypothetical protein
MACGVPIRPPSLIPVQKVLTTPQVRPQVRLSMLVGHGRADGSVAADGSASGREPPRVALILTWKPVSRWPELGLDRWGLLDRLT